VTRCPETTTLLSLYSKSGRPSERSLIWETQGECTFIQPALDAGVGSDWLFWQAGSECSEGTW